MPPGALVLDAACGIGIEALELTRRSFRVYGSDAAEAMTTEGQHLAAAEGLDVTFAVCEWAQLPSRFTERFALVVCNGNSLVHAFSPGDDGLERALNGMAHMVDDTERIVIGARNFEHLRHQRPDVEVADLRPPSSGSTFAYIQRCRGFREPAGRRCCW